MNMRAMRAKYDPVDAATQAVDAGVDIVMLAEEHYDHDGDYLSRQVSLIEGVRDAVRSGRISEARLDEAVGRVLRLKAGIAMRAPETVAVGTSAHRAGAGRGERGGDPARHHRPAALGPSSRGTLVNTTRREAYQILGATRGIGPNQTDPAFDLLVEAVRGARPTRGSYRPRTCSWCSPGGEDGSWRYREPPLPGRGLRHWRTRTGAGAPSLGRRPRAGRRAA